MFPMVAVVVRPLDLYGLVLELVLKLCIEDPSVTRTVSINRPRREEEGRAGYDMR